MADKNYCDLIYAWFQCKSEWSSDGVRNIPIKSATFTNIGNEREDISIDHMLSKG